MKNKILVLAVLALIISSIYLQFTPTALSIGPQVSEMQLALEEHFDCRIKSSRYQLFGVHHRLHFELTDDCKSSLSQKEASEYLAAHFEEFKVVDDFILD